VLAHFAWCFAKLKDLLQGGSCPHLSLDSHKGVHLAILPVYVAEFSQFTTHCTWGVGEQPCFVAMM
jgi:hypothetical protein